MRSAKWQLVVCGVNHRVSTLEQREPLQLGREEIAGADALFGNLSRVLESVIISTCNRVEFFFIIDREHEPFDVVSEFYREFKGVDITPTRELFQTRKGVHAADHLFRVAAGMDSMVLGENQILGQVKEAYSCACSVKSVGKVLHRLFHQAFRVGKQVRSDTEMGKGACSVSSAAVEMLRSEMKDLRSPAILFIGVNQMISLAARNLSKIDDVRFCFVNRTRSKALQIAAGYNAGGHGLDQLPDLLSGVDVVISCTSSPVPLISRDMLEELLTGQPDKTLIIIDLAIPRDVDYPKDGNKNLKISDLEDINIFLRGQQKRREQAIPLAEKIIEQKLAEYKYWFDHVQTESLYNGSTASIESIRREELAPLLDKLSPELANELNRLSRRLIERVVRIAGKVTGPDRKQD